MQTCSLSIGVTALPLLLALLLALRRLAPTRPALAGAFSGLAAGAFPAALYALHCPETSAPFVALWYWLAMAGVAEVGALVGAALLRW